MGDLAIEADGLRRTFGDKAAVDGVDLAVREGEIYGFLGPNGAGKSTTVRMLCTLLGPRAAGPTVAGFDVADQPEQVRLRIGVALQDAALDPKQTGPELLRLQGRLYGLHRNEIDQRVDELAATGRHRRRPRRPHRHLLGRHEAPARPGRRARAQPRRCCSSTSPPPASTR